jgi:hypothetical protein
VQPDNTHPVDDIAYALATCSGYAYSCAKAVAMMMARMGLEKNHCLEIKLTDDAMFINSTAYLVQSEDGRIVILCYRGTSPQNLIDWLLDADVDPEKISLRLPPGVLPTTITGCTAGSIATCGRRATRS